MFSKYKHLIVNLVFPHLGFWSGNFFLIAHFPDRCLLVPFLLEKSENTGYLVTYDLKVGKYRQQIEQMTLCEYPRSFLDLSQRIFTY